MKYRQSLPSLADTRSEVPSYPASSVVRRLHSYRRSYSSSDVLYHGAMDVGTVSANFRIQEGQRQGSAYSLEKSIGGTPYRLRSVKAQPYQPGTPQGVDRYASSLSLKADRQGEGAGYSHIVDRFAVQVQYSKDNPAVDIANFEHVPTMLLPKIRPKPDIYAFMNTLREHAVIPADPRLQFVLGTGQGP